MPVAQILAIALPIAQKLIGWLIDRAMSNGVSTLQGTVAGGAVVAFLEATGCNLGMTQEALLGVIAALPGILATDGNKTGRTPAQLIKEAIADAKRPLEPSING